MNTDAVAKGAGITLRLIAPHHAERDAYTGQWRMSQRKKQSQIKSRARRETATDFDSPWKEAIDRYFRPFLAFFFPEAHADIDWDRGYEMLDKEFQQIVRSAERGRRVVDKLVKVWLKTGEETWILIHVEVQAQRDRKFPKRMHVYNGRISDRYDREVVSFAVLADDDPNWKPTKYEQRRWGFRTGTEFVIAKLLEYTEKIAALEADPNPFATLVVAHLKTLETRDVPAARAAWKLRLVKALFERGMSAEDVRQLYRFIDWIMILPEAMEQGFLQEVTIYEQEMRMPFITNAERFGIEKGKVEAFLEAIETILEANLGDDGLKLMSEIRAIQDPNVLREVHRLAASSASAAEVRKAWTRAPRPRRRRRT